MVNIFDRCLGCKDRKYYPEDASTICLKYGWDSPGFNWICPDGLQNIQAHKDLPNATRVMEYTVQIEGQKDGLVLCHKCKLPIYTGQLVVSRRVGTGGGKPGDKGRGPRTSTVYYHFTCGEEANLV